MGGFECLEMMEVAEVSEHLSELRWIPEFRVQLGARIKPQNMHLMVRTVFTA